MEDIGSTNSNEVPSWGSALPVDNVQEMVSKDPSLVPEKYIRDETERPNHSPISPHIPIIDLSLLSAGNEEELNKLDLACKAWGFFQVINHGVPEEEMHGIRDTTSRFFNLPLEEKNKFAMPPNDLQGYGQPFVVSDEQKLDWGDALFLIVYPSNYRKLDVWPTTPPQLIDSIESYSAEIHKVAKTLLGSLSLILGMDKDSLIDMHKDILQALRVNYYPTCSMPDHVLGISPHSDTSTITILMQDNDFSGLQIRHDGDWVSVKPIPDALVVNIGDSFEIWSNGKYKSIEHRAVTNKTKPRFSFASFISPNQNVELEPLDQMVDHINPVRLYKKTTYGDYVRSGLMKKLEGKDHTKTVKLELD